MRAQQLQFSTVTYNALINACACSGNMPRVESLLTEMAAQSIEPNVITFSTVIKGYCQENGLDRAMELLADMKKNKRLQPDEVTYNTVLDGCARFGLFDKGLKVIADMEAAGIHPTNFTLSVVAKLAHRSRRPAQAFELCEALAKKYSIRYNSHVYNNLVQAAAAMKDMDKAIGVFKSMLENAIHPDPRTYALLLKGCSATGATKTAEALLRAAYGLPGAAVAGARLNGGLAQDVLVEALEFLAAPSKHSHGVFQLLQELRQAGVAIDARLSLRLASQATGCK